MRGKKRGQANGARPSEIRTQDKESTYLKGEKNSPHRKVVGMKNVLKQILELIKFIL